MYSLDNGLCLAWLLVLLALNNNSLVSHVVVQVLLQRMQMDPELTLEKAKTFTRQKEAVREQQLLLESTTKTTTSVGQAQRSHQSGKRTQSHSFKPPPARPPSSKLCMRCGRDPHPHHQCPGKDVQCHKFCRPVSL